MLIVCVVVCAVCCECDLRGVCGVVCCFLFGKIPEGDTNRIFPQKVIQIVLNTINPSYLKYIGNFRLL